MTLSLALVLLLAGETTAAPVPKEEKVKAEEITPALVELVSRPAVQRELKLSAEERLKLIDGLEEADFNVLLNRLKRGPGPLCEGMGVRRELTEEHKACRAVVAGMLSKVQFDRLQQVEVQALGVQALRLTRVADAVALTDEQRKAVYAGGKITEQFDRLEKLLDGLTPAQRKVWDGLNGEKLEHNVTWSARHANEVVQQLLWIDGKAESPEEPKSTRHPPASGGK
jgi:hypothetical protein